jgi:predicted DCC family thiol-disulfide oxidoreductase YuxK
MSTALSTLPLLVYDGECGFCSTSVRWLESRFPHTFSAVPYQRTDLDLLGLTEHECHERVQWVGDVAAPVTTRATGARAVGALLRRGGSERAGVAGAAWRVVGSLTTVRPTSWAAAGIYSLVASNRQRLPGGTPTCRL